MSGSRHARAIVAACAGLAGCADGDTVARRQAAQATLTAAVLDARLSELANATRLAQALRPRWEELRRDLAARHDELERGVPARVEGELAAQEARLAREVEQVRKDNLAVAATVARYEAEESAQVEALAARQAEYWVLAPRSAFARAQRAAGLLAPLGAGHGTAGSARAAAEALRDVARMVGPAFGAARTQVGGAVFEWFQDQASALEAAAGAGAAADALADPGAAAAIATGVVRETPWWTGALAELPARQAEAMAAVACEPGSGWLAEALAAPAGPDAAIVHRTAGLLRELEALHAARADAVAAAAIAGLQRALREATSPAAGLARVLAGLRPAGEEGR